jgi:hypothetical protein
MKEEENLAEDEGLWTLIYTPLAVNILSCMS